MRVNLFLLTFILLLGIILWVIFGGALLVVSGFCLLLFIVVTIGYCDKAVLFFLGAREVRSNDEPAFHQAAAQEAYKLSLSVPHLYFYDGVLDRGFILQNRNSGSIVLSKRLMQFSNLGDLSSICFELLLQVKKGVAPKRTKVMFLIGLISWISHTMVAIFLKLFRAKEVAQTSDILLNYLLHPWLDLIFKLSLGNGYFRKLKNYLKEYPAEYDLLKYTGLKLQRSEELYSLPSRKMLEFSSVRKNRHFQNIQALEILPHEWDFLFLKEK